MNILFVSILTLIVSWVIIKITISSLRRLAPDIPNKRSSHNSIVPRAGGIAIIISSCLIGSFNSENSFLYFLPLALVGLLDDFFRVSRKIRFISQIITVLLIFISSNLFSYISNLNNHYLIILYSISIIIAGTAIINFVNFMDGIDGLVGGSMIIFVSVSSILISESLFILVGALFGFLIWNWNPARIFMGDVGSTFLGAFLAWALMNTSTSNELIGLFLIAFPLLGDSFLCLIRRIYEGQPIFDAHSLHLYQRLVQSGWSHSKVSTIYILSASYIALSFILGDLKYALIAAFSIMLLGLWLNVKYAKSFIGKSF